MPTSEEQALHDAILANLRTPSTARQEEDEELGVIRRNLRPAVLLAVSVAICLPADPSESPTSSPHTGDDDMVRALLPPSRAATAQDWRAARTYARDWRTFQATAEEVRTWLRAGARPKDGPLVAFLRDEGISPARAVVQFEHPTTGERVTVLDIARAVCSKFGIASADLGKALDEAGIERTRPRTSVFSRKFAG